MTKSFADFIAQNPSLNTNKSEQKKEQNSQQNQENIENLVNQFQGKSQDELLATLHSEVEKQKQNGTFNLQNLEKNIEMLSPFLSEQQKTNIKELLKQL